MVILLELCITSVITVSCFGKIQNGITFWYRLTHLAVTMGVGVNNFSIFLVPPFFTTICSHMWRDHSEEVDECCRVPMLYFVLFASVCFHFRPSQKPSTDRCFPLWEHSSEYVIHLFEFNGFSTSVLKEIYFLLSFAFSALTWLCNTQQSVGMLEKWQSGWRFVHLKEFQLSPLPSLAAAKSRTVTIRYRLTRGVLKTGCLKRVWLYFCQLYIKWFLLHSESLLYAAIFNTLLCFSADGWHNKSIHYVKILFL